jgi:hypothetical protein
MLKPLLWSSASPAAFSLHYSDDDGGVPGVCAEMRTPPARL